MNNQPVKTVNVAFHIFQASDGHGNYQDTPADRQQLLTILNQMNSNYSSGVPSDPVPGITQLPNYDSKIRFSLGSAGQERIYFYKIDTCYNSGRYSDTLKGYLKKNYPDRYNNYYNVYFAEGYYWVTLTSITMSNKGSGYTSAPTVVFSPAKAAQGFSATASVSNGKVDTIIINRDTTYKNWPADLPLPTVTLVGGGGRGATANVNLSLGANGYANTTYTVLLQMKSRWWGTFAGDLLSHEIGHSFSLDHIWASYICNHAPYYYDIFGYNGECPHIQQWDTVNPWYSPNDRICNNIMNYGMDTKYISPTQAGEMHRATTKGDIGKFVQETYINSPLVIDALTQPAYDLKLFCDITLTSTSGILELTKNLLLPTSAKVTINNGSILKIKKGGSILDFDNTPYDGEIIVKSGGKLLVDANAILALGGTGKITTEQGAIVEVISNGSINLQDQSYLNITGNITWNGNINIYGGGYVSLNGNITTNASSTLNITGNNNSANLIVVKKAATISGSLSSANISNGKVIMDNTSAQLIINNSTTSVTLNNIQVNSTYYPGLGIRINNASNVTVTNSTFQNVTYGLYLSRTVNSPVATISGSTFQNCQTGLLVYHSGATISNCTFTGNSAYGLNGVTLEKPLNCYSSTFTSNTSYGLTMTGTSASGVLLNSCTVSSNANGVQVSGPLTLKVVCGSISSNTYNGVTLTNSALIDADGANLGNNKVNIYGYGPTNSTSYNSFALKDGENDLRDNGTSGSYCMSGRFWAFTGGQVEVNNNWWRNGGGAPVNNTEYSLTGSAGALTLTDNSPNITYVPCTAPGNATTLMASAGLIDNYSYQTVTTSLGTEPLNTAVETILNDDPQKATVYDNYTRFELLNEVLANKLRKPNEGEKWYFEKAYGEMKSQIGKPTKDGEPLFKGPELSEARNKAKSMGKNRKAWKGQKETAEFRALVDEASLLAFEGRYAEAIALLQSNRASLATDDAAYLDIIICHLNVDKTVAEGNDSLMVDEEYALCEKCGGNFKSGDTNDGSASGAEQISDGFNPQSGMARIEIVPNPVSGTSNIEISLPGQSTNAKMVVFNSAGQQVMEQVLNIGNSKIEVNNRSLPAGLYLVNLVVEGQTVAAEKMVVME